MALNLISTGGQDGVDGNRIHVAAGVPTAETGKDGDLYINQTAGTLYGPKTDGEWGSIVYTFGAGGGGGSSILTGAVAPDDGDGSDGDLYFNTANGDVYKKASGAWGSAISNITGPAGDDGDDGAAGSVWRTSATAPDNADGSDGDLHLNTATGDVYGPKAAGSWGAITLNLRGPQGAAGGTWLIGDGAPDDGDGSNGDLYLDATNGDFYGPKAAGAWGSSTGNIRGPAGDDGADGAAGSTILSGAGAPNDANGSDGQFYLDTSAGSLYGPKASGAWGSAVITSGAGGGSITVKLDGANIETSTVSIDFSTNFAVATDGSGAVTIDFAAGAILSVAQGSFVVGGATTMEAKTPAEVAAILGMPTAAQKAYIAFDIDVSGGDGDYALPLVDEALVVTGAINVKTDAGTATITLTNVDTAMTDFSIAATTSGQSGTASGNNNVASGAQILVTVASSAGGIGRVSGTLVVTRTLAVSQ